ncbi:hypothetical protein S245_040694, partial [Arachis hypogaea]
VSSGGGSSTKRRKMNDNRVVLPILKHSPSAIIAIPCDATVIGTAMGFFCGVSERDHEHQQGKAIWK